MACHSLSAARTVLALALAAGLTLTFAAAPARAAPTEDDVASARAHYKRGSRLFDLRRYAEAAREFEQAYEAKDDPAFLYNIAQAYRLAGDNPNALGAYRSYLRRVPEAPNRVLVQQRIAELEKAIETQKQTQASGPTSTMPPAQVPTVPDEPSTATPVTPPPAAATPLPADTGRPGSGLRVAGIVLAALGVAALGAGTGLGVQASSISDEISHPPDGQVFDPSREEAGRSYNTAAIGLFAGGGALVVTGAVLAIIGFQKGRAAKQVSITPTVAPGRAGAMLEWRF